MDAALDASWSRLRELFEGGRPQRVMVLVGSGVSSAATGRLPERSGILHLHGHWRSPRSIVLGSDAYRKVRENDKQVSVLESLWIDRTWIYVGCGTASTTPTSVC